MSKIRVALIEDHDLTRIGLRIALQKRSEIDLIGEAANGSEGLKLLQDTLPDVGIVDIGLPELDGIELTKQFKASQSVEQGTGTKILILTLHDHEEEVLAAFAAGADSYCMKNISFKFLLEALKATYEGNAWIDPAIARIILSHTQIFSSNEQNSQTSRRETFYPTAFDSNDLRETYSLTERELQVLQLIVDGYSNAEIAQTLSITIGTVKTHVRNILNKLCAEDRTQAAVRAIRSGLVG